MGERALGRGPECRKLAQRLVPHQIHQVRHCRRAGHVMQLRELREAQGAGFEEPAQIGREVDDRRFEDDPGPGVVDVAQTSDRGLVVRRV